MQEGTVLDGRCRLIEAIGAGGFGQVREARDSEPDRLVAVAVTTGTGSGKAPRAPRVPSTPPGSSASVAAAGSGRSPSRVPHAYSATAESATTDAGEVV
ncbi:hypothetical protein [Streptomyces sp. NPDC048057]|uniref:hypothetical protein n=1 Tax=Streptomyces sp. NPDC048057 TaxID=3155628 RepID=UPI00340585BD